MTRDVELNDGSRVQPLNSHKMTAHTSRLHLLRTSANAVAHTMNTLLVSHELSQDTAHQATRMYMLHDVGLGQTTAGRNLLHAG